MSAESHQGSEQPRAYWRSLHKSREEILNVRAEMMRQRGKPAVVIDSTGRFLATPVLFFILLLTHVGWVVLNVGAFGVTPWDPPPFTLLATIASVEAPFIALLILMRQNRDSRIDELREEIDLQVVLHIEREVTRNLRLLDAIREKLDVKLDAIDGQEVLDEMKEELDPKQLMTYLRKHIEEAEGDHLG